MRKALVGATLGALALAAAASLAACESDRAHGKLAEETAKLRRDTNALAEALAAANAGTFIGPDDVIVGISEHAVATLFEETLPIEQTLPGLLTADAVTLRIDRVSVLFDSGFGTVRVDVRAWFTHLKGVAATASLSGGFSEARIDPQSHVLVARVGIDTLRVSPLPGGLLERVLRGPLLRQLNARAPQAVTRALPLLKLPVKLDQKLRIPPLNKDPVHVVGGSLPVDVTLVRMFASHGRLWLAVRPRLGKWQRDEGPP